MSREEEREELPFRVFRKAARLGLKAAKEATEATVKIAKTVPKAITKAQPGTQQQAPQEAPRPAPQEVPAGEPPPAAAVPFRRRRAARARLHRSPLEHRPAGVMEYHRIPDIRLSNIAGASTAVESLRAALQGLAGRILIAGPPGVGKSVVALAYAAELGKGIIDVNAGDPGVHEEGEQLLRDVFEVARADDYTVVIYNIEGLVRREYAGKVIIYDPYTDEQGGHGRVIIYDPYTDQEPQRVIIYDPYTRSGGSPPLVRIVEEAMDQGVRVVATTSSPTILPVSLRKKFQAIIPMRLPNYQDRLEILDATLQGITLQGITPDDIAAYTSGASVADLINISRALSQHQPADHAKLTMVLKAYTLTGELLSKALYT